MYPLHCEVIHCVIFIYHLCCRACERNEALYTAFNLSTLFDVRMEVVNTTEVRMSGSWMKQKCTHDYVYMCMYVHMYVVYIVGLSMWVCFVFTMNFLYPDVH